MESNDLNLEETSDIHKEKGSDSVSKLDLNLAISKDKKGSEGYGHANTLNDDGKEMDLSQEVQASPLLLVDGSVCGPESSYTRSSSMAPSLSLIPECQVNKAGSTGELCTVLTDDLVEKNLEDGQETSQSPICSGESNMAYHDGYSAKSSSPLKTDAENVGSDNYAGKLNSQLQNDAEMVGGEGKEMGDSAHHVSNLPSTADSYDHSEEMAIETCEPCLRKFHPYDGEGREKAGKFSKSLSDINEEVEGQNPVQYLELPSSREKMSSENGEVEQENSDLHSPGILSKRSASPLRKMQISSDESSPSRLASAGHTKCSQLEVVQEPFHSPTTPKHSLTPERMVSDGKEGLSGDHSSPLKLKSPSPHGMPQQDSQHRVGSPRKHLPSSPKRRYSPPVPQRRERSSSRSPIKRNDSSSRNRREGRKRSHSRSPYATDRHRRSPRRYSPRHRSPLGCNSRRRPPRRPWSPPPNRSTGVGRPGKNLFVAGFSFVTTERDLERKFSRFGHVRNVRIVRDKRTGDSRGFGFLSFDKDEDADAAIRALDQMEWNGRIVLVEKSKTCAP